MLIVISRRGVGEPYMVQVGFRRKFRFIGSIFFAPKVEDQAFCLFQKRGIQCVLSGKDRVQRLLALCGSSQVCIPLLLHPFPHIRHRLITEDRKSPVRYKGIIPQLHLAGAVIHALHGEDTPVFLQLHPQGNILADVQTLNDLILSVFLLPKGDAVSPLLELAAHSLPALGKAGDRNLTHAGDVLFVDLAGIIGDDLRGICAAEQDVLTVLHTDHVRRIFCFQTEICFTVDMELRFVCCFFESYS